MNLNLELDTSLLPSLDLWATQIPARSGGKFKIHQGKNRARNAINNFFPNGRGRIFHLVGGKWELFYEIPKPVCMRCGIDDVGGFDLYINAHQKRK